MFSRNDNGTIEIKLTLPWADLQAQFEKEVLETVAATELPGFRKGKAPRDMVEPKLNKDELYSHSVQHLLPDLYTKALKEHEVKPILYPQIKIDSAEPNKDWTFTATTCEAPKVTLEKYQDLVKKVTAEPKDTRLGRIIEALRTEAKVTIPDMLVEEEANHRLASLAENLTQIGLTTKAYLESKHLTPEDLKSQLAGAARTDLTTEFILEHIQTSEKLADRQKTLDFLLSMV